MPDPDPQLRELAHSLVGKRVEVRWTYYRWSRLSRWLRWFPSWVRLPHRIEWPPVHYIQAGVLTGVVNDHQMDEICDECAGTWVGLYIDDKWACYLDRTVKIKALE
jgi:hypothetical protein